MRGPRLPIRLRIAVASAVVTAVLLAIAGLIVYERLGSELDASLDGSLRARADVVTALVQQADSGLRDSASTNRPLADASASAAQILSGDGRVVDASPPFTGTALISGRTLTRALSSVVFTTVTPSNGGGQMRILATPLTAQDQRLVILVGASLEQRDEALATLLSQLLLVAPVGLVLASAAGWIIAGRALRPVAAIRLAADSITRERLDERIPRSGRRDELTSLTDTLNAMLDRLADAAQRERRFIADAAHELRSPLATLRAELELARRRPRGPQQIEAVLDSALAETERLCRLADNLLLLARAEQGELELHVEQVDLVALLDGVARRFAAAATLGGRELRVTPPATSIVASCDRLRIEQAVGNLVDNALHHGAGTVTLGVDGDENGVAVSVRDEGGGFPVGIADATIRPFQRGPDSGSEGGSGLGLAIVSEIARAHHGALRTSLDPAGFTVELRLETGA